MTKSRNTTLWLMASRWLAFALPLLVLIFAVFPYGLRESNNYVTGVFGGMVMLLLVNVLLLPSRTVGLGCLLFGFVLPIIALFLAAKYWKDRRFWLAWLLYLVILAWNAWLGIATGKVIGGFGTMS